MRKFKEKFIDILKMMDLDYSEEPTGDILIMTPAEKIRLKMEVLYDKEEK